MSRLIASAADYRTYVGDESADPSEADLRSAARLVLRATRRAVYTVGGDGKAVDPDVEQTLVDATCEVLKARAATGASSEAEAKAASKVTSASLGSSSYTISPGSAGVDWNRLPFEASAILEAAGLIDGPVAIVG